MIKVEVNNLKGVGDKTQKALNSLSLYTVEDILNNYPRDYEFRGECKKVDDMIDGELTSFIGEVYKIYPYKKYNKFKGYSKIVFKNNNDYITGVWFNQPYICKTFLLGEKVFLYGKVEVNPTFVEMKEIQHHKIGEKSLRDIYPIYSLNKNMTQSSIRKIVLEALNHVNETIFEFLPESMILKYNLLDHRQAIKSIHYPINREELNAAIDRMKFNELLVLNLAILLAKNEFSSNKEGIEIGISKDLKALKESIPFTLTGAQSRVVREILFDMKGSSPMNRLVQGDVGSGKTMVATIAMFNVVKMGFQASLMAPTEILARQHFESIRETLKDFNINIEILTGGNTKKQKREILERLKNGEIQILIGTHALIEDNVEFSNLALVITDEQHRFGVRQRAKLVNKGKTPHVLVMTATPIPRTLAIFMYGDMDISIIDELPKGRQSIETYYIDSSKKERAFNFIKKEINKGRQCYIVCPLVEESEKLNLSSAVEMVEELKSSVFRDYSVGLLHGKMKASEKDEVMNRFSRGEINILVSTTVIEVGVNVPNSTVMYIENAERFGLSQLHQLRGRVGRGSKQSYCILSSDSKTKETLERIKIMTSTNDGFVISEKDMELRGFGEFFGTRQHGVFQFKVANLLKDVKLLKLTRDIAKSIIQDNLLESHEYKSLYDYVKDKYLEESDLETMN
ncbi:ATP-dependent DNA helicase RecG [Clostridium sp.]|uniref:ATP-dependent DNA helicase RecG n=1 Tax=Clostridium sp. TaxID=1506 RepID=UPI002FC65BEE